MVGIPSLRSLINLLENSSSEYLYHGTSESSLESILRDGIDGPSYWGTYDEASNYADGVMFRVSLDRFAWDGLQINDLLVSAMREDGSDIPMPANWQESLATLGSIRYDFNMEVSTSDVSVELHEGKKKQKSSSSPQEEVKEWKIVTSDIFPQMLVSTRKTFADIDDKLAKFVQVKLANPLDPNNRFGKHDRPMTGHLTGFLHCHLRDDAILIYTLSNRNVNLIALVTHAEIEGKRLQKMAKKLGSYLG